MTDAVGGYRSLAAAAVVLTELAAGADGEQFADVLAGDAFVLARMRAALAVVTEAGFPAGETPAGAGLLSEADRWQCYARGPVSPLHRDCATDIARGLLRLWARERAPRSTRHSRWALRTARVELLGLARSRCAALRVELREGCAAVRGDEGAFRAEVTRRADRVVREVADAVGCELSGPYNVDLPSGGLPGVDLPPPPRPGGPEHRLSLLLGAGFGTGAALAVARLLAEAWPAGSGAVSVAAAGVGLLLGAWVARTRRAIGRRAVLDRWVGEVAAALRAGLDEYIAARILSAEVSLETRR